MANSRIKFPLIQHSLQHAVDQVSENEQSQLFNPSWHNKYKYEKDNMKIIRSYTSHISRRSFQFYRNLKKFCHIKRQMKLMNDKAKKRKERANKEYALFKDRYLSVIKLNSNDKSEIEHIYIISRNLDPTYELKDELGLGPKTKISMIKEDYEKISPGLTSLLNSATTVILAKSEYIHKQYKLPHKFEENTTYSNNLKPGTNTELMDDASTETSNFYKKNDSNQDFSCKVLNCFNNDTGYLLSKTYYICNCSNVKSLQVICKDFQSSKKIGKINKTTDIIEEPIGSAVVEKEMENVNFNSEIADSINTNKTLAPMEVPIDCTIDKNKIIDVTMFSHPNIKLDIGIKSDNIKYNELYKTVTGHTSGTIEPFDNSSIFDTEYGPPFWQLPSSSIKETGLNLSNLADNSNEKLEKEKSKCEIQAKDIEQKQSQPTFVNPKNRNKFTDLACSEKANRLLRKLSNYHPQMKSNRRKYVTGNLIQKSEPIYFKKLKQKVVHFLASEQRNQMSTKSKSSNLGSSQSVIDSSPSIIGSDSSIIGSNPSILDSKPLILGSQQLNLGQKPSNQSSRQSKLGSIPSNQCSKQANIILKNSTLGSNTTSFRETSSKPSSLNSKPSSLNSKPSVLDSKQSVIISKPSILSSHTPALGLKPSIVGLKPSNLGPKPSVVGSNLSILGSKLLILGSKPSILGSRQIYLGSKPSNQSPGQTNLGSGPPNQGSEQSNTSSKNIILGSDPTNYTANGKEPDITKSNSALNKRNTMCTSLIKEEFEIKHETDNNNITSNQTYLRSQKEDIAKQQGKVKGKPSVKVEELNIKLELPKSGNNAANGSTSSSTVGLLALRQRVMKYEPIIKQVSNESNIKKESKEIQIPHIVEKNKFNNSSLPKQPELHVEKEIKMIKKKNKKKRKNKEKKERVKNKVNKVISKNTSSHKTEDQGKGKEKQKCKNIKDVKKDKSILPNPNKTKNNSVNVNISSASIHPMLSNEVSNEVDNSNINCVVYNSIIAGNIDEQDYSFEKNCQAVLMPGIGNCMLVFPSHRGSYKSFFISRYNYVCINGATIRCIDIKMPLNILFDGILKKDGTIKTILVMWTGFKPNFFDSYRLINGKPETTDYYNVQGILSRTSNSKMIIKTQCDRSDLILKCSDSIINRKIFNIDSFFAILREAHVDLYLRKRNLLNGRAIWTISWLIIYL